MMDNLELTGTRPPSVASSRPSSRTSNRPKSGYHRLADNSNVDELLFSSHHPKHDDVLEFKAPWDKPVRSTRAVKTDRDTTKSSLKKSKMRPLLWAPGADDRESKSCQSDRNNVLKSSNRGFNSSIDSDHLNKYRPRKYTPSFCDETLFGTRLEEPSFAAPWAEKVNKKNQPLMFSPMDYAKLTREQSTMSAKYSSSGTMDGRPPSRQGRRPVTASTRPVTVEGIADEGKMVWRP